MRGSVPSTVTVTLAPEPVGGPIDPIHPIPPVGGQPIVFGHEHPDAPTGSGGGGAWPEGIQPAVEGAGSATVVPLSTTA